MVLQFVRHPVHIDIDQSGFTTDMTQCFVKLDSMEKIHMNAITITVTLGR